VEKRKQAQEDMKAARSKPKPLDAEETDVLDNLLKKLRLGEGVSKRPKRQHRPAPAQRTNLTPLSIPGEGSETANVAMNMLAALKEDGFALPFTPTSPRVPRPRRSRLRAEIRSGDEEELQSPQPEDIPSENDVEADGVGDETIGRSSRRTDSRQSTRSSQRSIGTSEPPPDDERRSLRDST